MRIRMYTWYSRAADGINVVRYEQGQKYDLPENEARLLISIGVACEDKDLGHAPEVKAAILTAPSETTPEPKGRKRKKGLWVKESNSECSFESK